MASTLKLLNLPPLTRFILLANIILTSSFFYTRYTTLQQLAASGKDITNVDIPMFQLIPSRVLTHPWTLILSSFSESSILGAIVLVANSLVSIQYFEKIWGSKETVKFLLVVCFFTNLLTCVTAILAKTDGNCGGCFSTLLGFAVAFKQLIPEHNLMFFKGLLHLRVKHVPFIICVAFAPAIYFTGLYPAIPAYFSLLVAWMYLRFFQSMILEPLIPLTSEDASSQPVGTQRIKGDASDTFAFASFFPDMLQPYLSPIFSRIYDSLCLIGVIPAFNENDVASSNERALQRGTSRSRGSNNIAERRRQVALKVLEERIGGV